jgi:acetyl esterase/lipase
MDAVPVLRLIGGLLLASLAALTVLPVSASSLWTASIAVTEAGYLLVLVALLPLLPGWRRTAAGRVGGLLSMGAIVLFVAPIVYAMELSRELPAAFEQRFGQEQRARPEYADEARAVPFDLPQLLYPAELSLTRFERRTFPNLDGKDVTIDIYRPSYPHGRIPAVVVLHGGFWQEGDSMEFVALNAYLAARGYVVAVVNYRLLPEWPFPAARDDVLSTIAYLKVRAKEFGVDPSRFAILGRSGGAQLALLVAYALDDPAIRGAISLYGPSDLAQWYSAPGRVVDARGTLQAYLGGPPEREQVAYEAASPISFVRASTPATLLVHGMRDDVVPAVQSERLAARLQELGVRHLLVRMPWATHGCDRSFAGPCGQIATYAVERFLDSVMVVRKKDRTPPARKARAAKARTKRGGSGPARRSPESRKSPGAAGPVRAAGEAGQ